MSKVFKIRQFDAIHNQGKTDCIYFESSTTLPIIPVSDNVLFPHNILPLGALDKKLKAKDLRAAGRGSLRVGIVSVSGLDLEKSENFSTIGTEGVIENFLKLPSGEMGAVVKGLRRFRVENLEKRGHHFSARVVYLKDIPLPASSKSHAFHKAIKTLLEKVLKFNPAIAEETRNLLMTSDDLALISDLMAPQLSIKLEEKLELLACVDVKVRSQKISKFLSREIEYLKIANEIHDEVSGDLHENDRRQYLKEQIKAIKRELGEMEGVTQEVDTLEEQIDKLHLEKLTKEAVKEELERMNISGPGSPEYIVSYNYVTLVRDLPWQYAKDKAPTLNHARQILEQGHFGLEKVKEKILDYLAVMLHRGNAQGNILLLSGPPGVGKTSLAKSIADALGRKFARIALGGVKDEAEIRGHRRTYIGSMPGKIIQALKQTGTQYSLILLDEIDKVGTNDGLNAGVSAALLEVLDPEQNKTFVDHYLAVPFDLSKVLFVATANNADNIPNVLLDRMEVVHVSSYTMQEKLEIARRYLLPSIRNELNLSANMLKISDELLTTIIDNYTREAGVRQLRRELSQVARKIVKLIVEKKLGNKKTRDPSLRSGSRGDSFVINAQHIQDWLGQYKFLPEPNDNVLTPGVAIGLAYTEIGGDILYVEATRTKEFATRGRLNLTGFLGKVMQESAQAALTFLLAHAESFGIDMQLFEQSTIHVHMPDGGTPKDGPSAGVAILCAIASCLLNKPMSASLTMTGEITLRGQVMAVGGVREKILAAHRYGKKRVLLPKANKSDLADIPLDVKNQMDVVLIANMEDALMHAELIPWKLLGQRVHAERGKRQAESPGFDLSK